MPQTTALIVGAGFAGLACAASLHKRGVGYIILEKGSQVADPWHRHYQRLHLHTSKNVSNLPFYRFPASVPIFPSRQQVLDYLEDYRGAFGINPVFNAAALSAKRENGFWNIKTALDVYRSKYLIVCTGLFAVPNLFKPEGIESFPGNIIHSAAFRSGKDFAGQRVLVVGFGNSACEIAIDLYEQGAMPSMSVRSAVNIVPRTLAGIPILQWSQVLSKLPPRVADAIISPVMRMRFGNLQKLGLRPLPYGPFTQIRRDGRTPVLDIGTVKHIREGHIRVCAGIDHIEAGRVYFSDGRDETFDAIIAATGYSVSFPEFLHPDNNSGQPETFAEAQKSMLKDHIYFCGFNVKPTGLINEISREARRLADDVAGLEMSNSQP